MLRKQPPGKLLKSAHMIDREYRVMRALQDANVRNINKEMHRHSVDASNDKNNSSYNNNNNTVWSADTKALCPL